MQKALLFQVRPVDYPTMSKQHTVTPVWPYNVECALDAPAQAASVRFAVADFRNLLLSQLDFLDMRDYHTPFKGRRRWLCIDHLAAQ